MCVESETNIIFKYINKKNCAKFRTYLKTFIFKQRSGKQKYIETHGIPTYFKYQYKQNRSWGYNKRMIIYAQWIALVSELEAAWNSLTWLGIYEDTAIVNSSGQTAVYLKVTNSDKYLCYPNKRVQGHLVERPSFEYQPLPHRQNQKSEFFLSALVCIHPVALKCVVHHPLTLKPSL